MHLRVLSRAELLKLSAEPRYGMIDSARTEAEDFLKKYDGDTRLEDKYREIYQAYKYLKTFPSTREAYETETAAKREAFVNAEAIRKEKLAVFMQYTYVKAFTPGQSVEDFKKQFGVKSKHIFPQNDGDLYANGSDAALGGFGVYFRNGRTYKYIYMDWKHDAPNQDAAKQKLADKIAYFTDLFGFPPEIKPRAYRDDNYSGADHTWKKGNKTFILEAVFVTKGPNNYTSALYYTGIHL